MQKTTNQKPADTHASKPMNVKLQGTRIAAATPASLAGREWKPYVWGASLRAV